MKHSEPEVRREAQAAAGGEGGVRESRGLQDKRDEHNRETEEDCGKSTHPTLNILRETRGIHQSTFCAFL